MRRRHGQRRHLAEQLLFAGLARGAGAATAGTDSAAGAAGASRRVRARCPRAQATSESGRHASVALGRMPALDPVAGFVRRRTPRHRRGRRRASPITCVPESVAEVPAADEPWPSKVTATASGPCSPRGSRRRRTCISCWRSWPAVTATFISTSSARSRIRRLLGPLPRTGVATACDGHRRVHRRGDASRSPAPPVERTTCMILPTLGENFGHVIVEAWTAGCPVLVSDRTPWRQLASHGVGWDVALDHRALGRRDRRVPRHERGGSPGDATTRPGAGPSRLGRGRRRRRIVATADRGGGAATGVPRRSRSRARDRRRRRHRPMRVAVVAPDLREPGGVREKALFVARSLTRPARRLGAGRVACDLSHRRVERSSAPTADMVETARLALQPSRSSPWITSAPWEPRSRWRGTRGGARF